MPGRLPSVFIGSSAEGLAIARAIQSNLNYACDVVVWSQGVFGLGGGTLENLVEKLDDFDFAVFVLTADDLVESRQKRQESPRDNVLLELGLFMGSVGRERTFMVYDSTKQLKLPSDLAGVTPATYRLYGSGDLQASLGTSCTLIQEAMKKLGLRTRKWHLQAFGNRGELLSASGFMEVLQTSAYFDLISFSANVLQEHQGEVKTALERGTKLRVLILDPGPDTAIYYDPLAEMIGETPKIKRDEAWQLNGFVSAFKRDRKQDSGDIELKFMRSHSLLYNLWLSTAKDGSQCGHLTFYFHGYGTAPSFRIRNPDSSVLAGIRNELEYVWAKSSSEPS